MKKLLLLSGVVAGLAFASSNALAVRGTVTISGTVLNQSEDAHSFNVMKSHGVSQKDLLFILAQATGDETITNKPTKIYYDPDAFNDNAFDSNQGYDFYGVFYYSNSVVGLQTLDGIDGSGDYYSYLELDEYNPLFDYGDGCSEGFFNPYAQEADFIYTESDNEQNWTANGNAFLYVHSNPYDYDILGTTSSMPFFYLADDWYSDYQQFSVTIHGSIVQKTSLSDSFTKATESFTLKGSGDVMYEYDAGVINGTVNFSAHGPNDY